MLEVFLLKCKVSVSVWVRDEQSTGIHVYIYSIKAYVTLGNQTSLYNFKRSNWLSVSFNSNNFYSQRVRTAQTDKRTVGRKNTELA